jgi:predicted Rossmann fold nucleotide-binding protein DprA/Smf involved in DNA uptake
MSMHGRFLIIAGSRNIDNIGEVFRALNRSPYSLPKKIISGGARGVDQLAIDVAELEGIPHEALRS